MSKNGSDYSNLMAVSPISDQLLTLHWKHYTFRRALHINSPKEVYLHEKTCKLDLIINIVSQGISFD
jgi:hypothetical protein